MEPRALVVRSDGLTLEGELWAAGGSLWCALLCRGITAGPAEPGDEGYSGLARRLAERGIAAAWFNFRALHGSPGDFSLGGWCRDLNAAIDTLRPLIDTPIALVGSSAGGSAAIRVASSRDDVAAVATLAAPASFESLSEDTAGALQRFRNAGILRDPAFPPDPAAWGREFSDLSPIEAIGSLAPRPLLLVHGDADEIVPPAHAERLFERAREPKELVRIPGGSHQLRRDPRAIEAVIDWLARHQP